MRSEPRFSLVSHAPEKLAAELGPWLKDFEPQPFRCLTPAGLADSVLSPREILIVDFTSAAPDGFVLPTGQPVLGVLPKGMGRTAVCASLCTEVVAWPGDQAEFVMKLQRLCRLVGTDNRLEQILTLKLNLIGTSSALQHVLSDAVKYARCDAPVLLMGETGTGKEQIARAIHYLAADDNRPFVAVNCGALPDNLVENELFGHARGAYTDARESHCGLVEQAEGGTLFLDEIEALSPKGQVALLRFLPTYEYRPLGSQQQTRRARLRLITASNEPLEQLTHSGSFRKDLFYRLNILPLYLPPLRERTGDVELLAEHFVNKYREVYNQYDKFLAPQTLAWMTRYDWPGNVRELENLILREFLRADSNCISIPPMQGAGGERRRNGPDRRHRHLFTRSFQDAKAEVVWQFEHSYLQQVLRDTRGNVSAAARQAGKERRTFTKLLDKHGL
jgi:DNA-binding NtrC family response regulator